LVTYDTIIGNGRWFDGIGDRADLVVIDPARLDATRDGYADDRNDETVSVAFVGGRAVFLDGTATDLVAKRRTGRFLRTAHKAPAVTMLGGELASVS
jgi:N-acyl-D-aspartate/D-glutamate deacylase